MSAPIHPAAAAAGLPRRAQAVSLIVATAFFMEMLDGTVITTALPQMAADFGTSPVALNLGITAYLLALAVFLPVSGWIADRFGGRAVFVTALAGFVLASLACAASGSLPAFIVARVAQGMAGAAMVPVGRLIVLRTTDKRHLMQAMALIVWPGLVAPVLGPPVGGWIVTRWSWPWIFLLNLPIGLAAIVATLALVPDHRPAQARPLDWTGVVLSGLALALLVYGIDALGHGRHPPLLAAALIAAGFALGWLAVRHFRRHPTPLLDLAPFRIPTFAVGMHGGSVARVAIGATPFLLPLMFQIGFGWDALRAGSLLLWMFAGDLAMKPINNRVLRRFGFRRVMLVNGVLLAASIAACALLTKATPLPLVALLLFACGGFRSMQFTAITAIQFADVAQDKMAGANTLANMVTKLSLGLGVVAGAAALNLGAALRGDAGGAPQPADFRLALLGLALVALLALRDTARLDRDAGRALRV
ncbi:MFS transporter [Sphingomonas quercus]|uniref:MFS transporter n=1 Tax=Sphingomonas quercus TaxID=2842451 RepID=A0ABS6BED5_9SPHN|nr:MFS transporter [Sphingomonas quercus]MBU3076682.1 MFS transporter [Sphingomonas quercus]